MALALVGLNAAISPDCLGSVIKSYIAELNEGSNEESLHKRLNSSCYFNLTKQQNLLSLGKVACNRIYL